MNNDDFIEHVVIPQVRRSQGAAAIPGIVMKGVGPFAALLDWPYTEVVWALGRTIDIAVQRIQVQGGVPLVVMDYVAGRSYSSQEMADAMQSIGDQSVKNRIEICGGESAEMDFFRSGAVETAVVVLGAMLPYGWQP